MRPRLAVLASGGGRSLENLCERIDAGELACEVGLVLSDREGAKAIERAVRRGIAARVVVRKGTPSAAEFAARCFAEIEAAGCELVVLAGFLSLLPVPPAWSGRVLNIHPSLLPAFGGKGFYGDRVHAAVLESGVATTGCTVHYVDGQYDHGPILLQRAIAVLPEDDVVSLAARVFEEEKLALPEAIRMHFARQRSGVGGVESGG